MGSFFKGLFKFLSILIIAAAVVACVVVFGLTKSDKDSKPTEQPSIEQTERKTEKPRQTDKTDRSDEKDDDSKLTEKPDDSDDVDENFRAAMNEYEAFIDEYVKFIKKYEKAGAPVSMLADYTKMTAKYSEFAAAMAEYESEELSDADAAYLIEVNARVQAKLLTLN